MILGAEARGSRFDTCISYCHFNLHDTTLLTDLAPFLDDHGLALINASALSMGLLTPRGPPSWHPATEGIKAECAAAVELCDRRGVDIAKIALFFALSEEGVATTLASTHSTKFMQANLEVAWSVKEGKLSTEERRALRDLRKRFEVLNLGGWEGVEPSLYKEMLAKAKRGENVDATLSAIRLK